MLTLIVDGKAVNLDLSQIGKISLTPESDTAVKIEVVDKNAAPMFSKTYERASPEHLVAGSLIWVLACNKEAVVFTG